MVCGGKSNTAKPEHFSPILYWLRIEIMPIITLTEALLQKLSMTDGRILRDQILCGFCLRANKQSRIFLVATSVQGKQFRMTLGRWPLTFRGSYEL